MLRDSFDTFSLLPFSLESLFFSAFAGKFDDFPGFNRRFQSLFNVVAWALIFFPNALHEDCQLCFLSEFVAKLFNSDLFPRASAESAIIVRDNENGVLPLQRVIVDRRLRPRYDAGHYFTVTAGVFAQGRNARRYFG